MCVCYSPFVVTISVTCVRFQHAIGALINHPNGFVEMVQFVYQGSVSQIKQASSLLLH